MACVNRLCPFNNGIKCSNELAICIVRDLYNAKWQQYARSTYTTKQM